ncbi:AGE family epimerase/isomerase [Persicobacter psychrovividus]|uniref:Uncharacterized protein n=1 Tax=Persicobacter psychrovividus TaxID=387638 RepID=A0ABM7VJQ8_9BACT|nr:hypothetical protein PEPS_34860 [Persicobacter psychrovividus]
MKKHLLIFLWLIVAVPAWSQSVNSQFLKFPEQNIDFVKGVADFHISLEDPSGGYFTFADLDGVPLPDQSGGWEGYEYKSLCAISRSAYAFARAFQLTGDIVYLQHARRALNFLYEKGWDRQHDGWYFTYDETNQTAFGAPWAKDEKWIFQQEYATVGIMAMMEALGGTPYLSDGQSIEADWMNLALDNLDDHWWDDRADYLGFYEKATSRNSAQNGKGFTGTIDGINTHAALLANISQEPQDVMRFRDLSDISRDRLAGALDLAEVKAGFPEVFSNNWEIDQSKDHSGVGHVLKTAWCLGRAAVFFKDPSYQKAAEKLLDHVWESNQPTHEDLYDHTYGAPFSDVNWKTGKRKDQTKNHWVLEQGLTGGLMNYYSTTDETKRLIYLQIADESMDFFEKNMLTSHGVSYANVTQDGALPVGDLLADAFKAGFHDAELGYMTYLYAHTYLHARAFDLYYHFNGKTTKQVRLAPLIVKDEGLSIESVSYNGADYTAFNSKDMTVDLNENIDGIFKVTFKPNERPLDPQQPLASAVKESYQVFPSVFESELNIQGRGIVSAVLLDAAGRTIQRFPLMPDLEHQQLEVQPCTSGLYLLKLIDEQQQQSVHRLIKH